MNNPALFFLPFRAWNGRSRVDGCIIALAGVVLVATILAARGDSARAFHVAGNFAVAALFFLQGARLSPNAIVLGMTHWRLHAAIATMTFVLFPLLGLGLFVSGPLFAPATVVSRRAVRLCTAIDRAVVDRPDVDRRRQCPGSGVRRDGFEHRRHCPIESMIRPTQRRSRSSTSCKRSVVLRARRSGLVTTSVSPRLTNLRASLRRSR